jgi:tetratricopeptide (TPR) repeat protein
VKILKYCTVRNIKIFIILSTIIGMLVYQLQGITEGGDENKHNKNEGQTGGVATVSAGTEQSDPLYNQAMSGFQAGRYSEALENFKIILQQEPGESPKREKILRRIADCHYFLGMEGKKNDLMTAPDLYKNIMQQYPSNRDENAIALYRVANSYVALNFYYEAKREFENFSAAYPQSPYMPEVVFRIGEMLYKTKKFSEAAEKFEDYVRKYPAGDYIKAAYFNLGDCYSQIQQEEKAGKWYQDALNKWPDLENIPEDFLLSLGFHYFRSMKYHDALKIFSLYINIFPDRNNYKEVLFTIARSFMELDQIPLSLKMFSLVIEKFPNSREAAESAIIMANIGVKKPGMKLPSYFHGMLNYHDPLNAYNTILAQFSASDYVEELLFQKGYVLNKKGRYKESFDTYGLLLNQFPQGKYKAEAVKYFLDAADQLVSDGYTKGDYLSVSDIYFKSRDHSLITGDNFKMSYIMGDSLRRVGLHDESMEVFEKLLKTCGNVADRNKIVLAIADVESGRGNYENVERLLQQISMTPPENERRLTLHKGKSKRPGKGIVKHSVQENHIQRQINRILGNVYFKKGLFDKAAQNYAMVLTSSEGIDDVAVIHRNYAECLKAMNSLSLAMVNFQKAIEIYNRESQKYSVDVVIDSYRGLGDCLFEKKEYMEAISMYKQSLTKLDGRTEGLWSIYGMGRGYVELKNSEMADKTFSELKNRGGEGFWSLLADYALREFSWNEKYTVSQN